MEKIKQFIEGERGKTILFVFIVILVGLASFELGRLSKNSPNPGIKIEYPANTLNQTANALDSLKTPQNTGENLSKYQSLNKNTTISQEIFFASKRGHKYYPESCSAGKSIKKENRVYFGTKTEAESAGYTLSSSCE